MGWPLLFGLGAAGGGGLYGFANRDETPITYDTNKPITNYTSPGAYRNWDLTQTAVRHPASGYIDKQGNQVMNPPYYVDDNGQVQFITEPPTYPGQNLSGDSVRFTGNRNDPITMVNADGTVGTIPATGPVTPNTGPMPGTNGISAADLAALAKEAQATPDYAAMTTEQMSTMPTHTMPDGTVHPGATHADYLAMQQQQAQDAMTRGMNAYNQIDPGMKEAADTDRKRDRTSFGEMLLSRMNQAEPGMLTPAEKMIRTGSAIVGAADQGGLAAMEAAGKAYGGIQDYERLQEQQQIENYINSLTSSGQLTGQQQSDLVTEIGGYEDQLRMMDTALTGLEGATDITGPIAGTWGSFWDPRSTDDKKRARATIRLQLKRLRVSNILENTKNTKGAISDKEMALFAEDSPTMDMQEGVWVDFITRRRDVLRRVVYRLKNNIRVDPKTGIEYSADRQEIAPTTNAAPQYSQEDMDTLNKYGLGQ